MLDFNLGAGGGDGDSTKELVRKLVLNQRELTLRLSKTEKYPYDPALYQPRTGAEQFTKTGFDAVALTPLSNVQIANGIVNTTGYLPTLIRLDATTVLVCAHATTTSVGVTLIRVNAATGAVTAVASTSFNIPAVSRSILSGVAISADKAMLVVSIPDNVTHVAQVETYDITVDRAVPSVAAASVRTRAMDVANLFPGQISSNPRILKSSVNAVALVMHMHNTTSSTTGSTTGPCVLSFFADPSVQGAQIETVLLQTGGPSGIRAAPSHDLIGDNGMLVAYQARGLLQVAVVRVLENEVRVCGTLQLGAVTSSIYVYAISPSLGLVCWYDGSTYRSALVRIDEDWVPHLSGAVDIGTRQDRQPYAILLEDADSYLGFHFASTLEANASIRPHVVALDGTKTDRAFFNYAFAATCNAPSLDVRRLTATDAIAVYRETSSAGVNLRVETMRLS